MIRRCQSNRNPTAAGLEALESFGVRLFSPAESPSDRTTSGCAGSDDEFDLGLPANCRAQPRMSVVGMRNEQLIDVGDVAERLGVGERFVRRLVAERRIPFLKVGRHLRFNPVDVEQWILSHRVDAWRP